MTLITASSWLPSRKARRHLIDVAALTAYIFSRAKRRFIECNIFKTFGGKLGTTQLRRIAKGVFRECWHDIFSWLPANIDTGVLENVEVRGLDHLRDALKSGKGVILWESNGFGKRVISKQILAAHSVLVHQVHGPNMLGGFLTNNSQATWVRYHIVRPFFERCERRFVAGTIYLNSSGSLMFTRQLLRVLQENGILCITGDGKVGRKLIPVPFLAKTELFATGMVSLARISGAQILPMFCFGGENGKTRLILEKPVSPESKTDREEGLRQGVESYARLLESYVVSNPEQYRNWHLVGLPPPGNAG
jgi:lauroyl/myristoyl acyltransferase